MISMKTFLFRQQKNRKLSIKKELVEKYKDNNPDFKQNHFSTTAKSICETKLDSIRLTKWIYFDR